MDNNSANPNNINTNPSSPISQPNPFPSINPLPTESKNTVPETNNLNSQSINEIIKPKKSNSFLIFILFLLLLIAAGTAAFFGYKYFELFKEKSSLSSIIIPSTSPSIEPTAIPAELPKLTCSSTELGLNITLPSNSWECVPDRYTLNIKSNLFNISISSLGSGPICNPTDTTTCKVETFYTDSNLNLSTWTYNNTKSIKGSINSKPWISLNWTDNTRDLTQSEKDELINLLKSITFLESPTPTMDSK